MKTEQFHDLNMTQAQTILDMVGQLTELAEMLVCMVRVALDNISPDPEIAWAN